MAERLQEAGVTNAGPLARQVLVLLDGAVSTHLVHRDAEYVKQAGVAAAVLVEGALRGVVPRDVQSGVGS